MGLSVNTNIAAMNSYRNLSTTNSQMTKSLEKLSSGFRINRAADDAAGLAISEGLRSQIGGLKVAVRNTQDGISVVQTAEGALNETTSILQRMRDLSVQASNEGGLNAEAKSNIQSEMSQLKSELNRIADTTTFNGKKLLDSSYAGKFQVGANAGETISVAVGTSMSATGLKVDGVDVKGGAATNATVAYATGSPTAAGTAGTATIAATDVTGLDDYKALNGTITVGSKSFDLASVDYTGVADATAAQTKLAAAATAALGTSVSIAGGNGADLVFTGQAPASGATADQVAAASVKFGKATGAENAITAIEAAIKTVSTTRADLGAVQNRFEHTINNLNTAVENLSASESRIRDTDMAQEMTNFSRTQILTQAGTAMLAQANQSSQGILKLLG
jgi:flagellin-like hook-associated protein FlgL